MLCCAVPRRVVPHWLLSVPTPKAVPGSSACQLSCVSLPVPLPPQLSSHDPAQRAGTTSGSGPCKQLSHASCQLFTCSCRATLRNPPEGSVRGRWVTTSLCLPVVGRYQGGAASTGTFCYRNTSAASGLCRPSAPCQWAPGDSAMGPLGPPGALMRFCPSAALPAGPRTLVEPRVAAVPAGPVLGQPVGLASTLHADRSWEASQHHSSFCSTAAIAKMDFFPIFFKVSLEVYSLEIALNF